MNVFTKKLIPVVKPLVLVVIANIIIRFRRPILDFPRQFWGGVKFFWADTELLRVQPFWFLSPIIRLIRGTIYVLKLNGIFVFLFAMEFVFWKKPEVLSWPADTIVTHFPKAPQLLQIILISGLTMIWCTALFILAFGYVYIVWYIFLRDKPSNHNR